MKKSLLALAVVAALPGVALAQSSVTISGNIKTGLTRFSTDSAVAGLGKIKDTAVSDGSSKIIISGTEDLGGGMSAIFQIDNRYNGNDGNNGAAYNGVPQGVLAGGNTFVGLTGGFGKLQFGNLDTHYGKGTDEFGARATSLGASSTSLLDFVNGSPIANATRAKNIIRYTTPVVSGFSAQVDYSTSYASLEGGTAYQTAAAAGTSAAISSISPGKGQASHVEVNYSEGPIFAGVSYWDAKSELVKNSATFSSTPAAFTVNAAQGYQSGTKLYGSFDAGIVKIGANYDDAKTNATGGSNEEDKRKAWSLSATAPMGMGAILFQYTKAKTLQLQPTTLAENPRLATGATQVSLGYDYSLSKRTSVGVTYSKINNERNAKYNFFTGTALQNAPGVGAGTDTSLLYAGIQHKF